MKRTRPQFNRLVELDRRIKAGKYPNCLTFSAEWETSQKTIQRDVDYLRDVLGAPIEYDREKNGYFYTDDHWFLPSVSLSEGELVATLLAARALEQYAGTPVAGDLERIVGKLADLLPERISIRPEWLSGRFTFHGPPAKPVDPAIWTEVMRGLLHQLSVKITYKAMEATAPGERMIDPYHIANLSGEWYVLAWCHKKGMVTQFAIPRISKAAVTERGFEVPDDFDPKTYLAAAFARFASGERPVEVRLLFTAEVAPWVVEREWHPSQRLRKRKSGEIEMSFKATGLFEVLRWVLSWGSAVTVLGPESLKKDVAEEIQRMAQQSRRSSP